MNKRELINRWNTEKLNEIILFLKTNKDLSLIGIKKHNDRWDLRGVKLSSLKKDGGLKIESHSVDLPTGSLKLNKSNLDSIDFSFADLSFAEINNCTIKNCIFFDAKANSLDVIATNFSKCDFTKTNFSKSFLNSNINTNSGSYFSCLFNETNLSYSSFLFPIIEDCIFNSCKLIEVNFDGSRLKNCKFIGHFQSGWFRAYSIFANSFSFSTFHFLNPKKHINKMENVDFSECYLEDVLFLNEIDLSKCNLPRNENYIIVKNLEKVVTLMKKEINEIWEENDKNIALSWFDNLYYPKNKEGMKMDVINKNIDDNILLQKFFKLMEKYNN